MTRRSNALLQKEANSGRIFSCQLRQVTFAIRNDAGGGGQTQAGVRTQLIPGKLPFGLQWPVDPVKIHRQLTQ